MCADVCVEEYHPMPVVRVCVSVSVVGTVNENFNKKSGVSRLIRLSSNGGVLSKVIETNLCVCVSEPKRAPLFSIMLNSGSLS